ncbi:MAG TPA: hypothetical protein PLI45_03135 [Candidatus Woesebacteria bacterium]|mgnify:CR=1 FL=1|nr:hypothetical protein [Candidatus Woesebacteria bacterium]
MALIGMMGGVLAIFWKSLPPQLPWFYSLPWGEQQLVNKMWFVWILAGMAVLLFLTRIIARWAGKDDTTVKTLIMSGGLLAVLLMTASFVRIMMIFLNL